MPATLQAESDHSGLLRFFRMSCREHTSFAIGLKAVAMSLSVVASVHCCMVIAGIWLLALTFDLPQPRLRAVGISTGSASAVSAAMSGAAHSIPRPDAPWSQLWFRSWGASREMILG